MKMSYMIFMGVVMAGLCGDLDSLRTDFHKIKSYEDVESFILKYENCSDKQSKPYVASAIMRKAAFVILPHNKFKYFSRGKKALEDYIQNYPNCVEGRYVRILVQHEIPSFLGYNGNLKEDIEFVKRNLPDSGLPEAYRNLILENIKNMK